MEPKPQQLELELIPHILEKTLIHQRSTDGYVNATAMCKAVGKQFYDYLRIGPTQAFLQELSSVTGLPVTELVRSSQGGTPELQGTWVHPDVAVHLGQWCSPKFAVAVAQWVREWMSGKAPRAVLPSHLRRYMTNRAKVPPEYFSILSETTLEIVGPLEMAGYTVPDNFGLDISAGLLFCRYLKSQGVNTDAFKTYQHEYEDGRVVEAKLYPIEYVGDFRRFLREVWLPLRAPEYFKKRDPKALPFLPKPLPRSGKKAA